MPPATHLVGDRLCLKQILDHLLSNAVKFTQNGFVELSAGLSRDPDTYQFEVRDTGVGFAASQAERLFARFEQADGSLTRAHGGAGLGLAICRQLADLMGARIAAIGHPGRGAVFTLTAPFKTAAPVALPSAPVHDAGPRVLVVDDNAVNRKLVELILNTIEAEVVSVENGLEGVRAVEQDSFDLVLMDIQMPVMDGLTAIRRIRAWEPRARGRARRSWCSAPM